MSIDLSSLLNFDLSSASATSGLFGSTATATASNSPFAGLLGDGFGSEMALAAMLLAPPPAYAPPPVSYYPPPPQPEPRVVYVEREEPVYNEPPRRRFPVVQDVRPHKGHIHLPKYIRRSLKAQFGGKLPQIIETPDGQLWVRRKGDKYLPYRDGFNTSFNGSNNYHHAHDGHMHVH